MIELVVKYAQGNPGAMRFIMELMNPNTPINIVAPISNKLEQIQSLRGTNLYVLWSDLCNKDMSKVALLCSKSPNHILEDACSRQDYSGRELVKDYL